LRKREANLENVVSNVEADKSAAGTKSMFGTIIPEIGQNPVDAACWEQLEQRATRIEERKKREKTGWSRKSLSLPRKFKKSHTLFAGTTRMLWESEVSVSQLVVLWC
jgi:hypothetical protein